MQRQRRLRSCQLETLEDRRVLTAAMTTPSDVAPDAPAEHVEIAPAVSADQTSSDSALEIGLQEGDFNADGWIDADDVDLLCANMSVRGTVAFDLTRDGNVDQADMDMMIHEVLNTQYGDADLDGEFTLQDSKALFSNLFQTGTGWATGDFNCDQITDGQDFIEWNQSRNLVTPTVDDEFGAPIEEPEQIPISTHDTQESAVVVTGSSETRLAAPQTDASQAAQRSHVQTGIEDRDRDERTEDAEERNALHRQLPQGLR